MLQNAPFYVVLGGLTHQDPPPTSFSLPRVGMYETIDGRNPIFDHKLHIGTPYREKRFLTCQIPTSCLPKGGGIISEH